MAKKKSTILTDETLTEFDATTPDIVPANAVEPKFDNLITAVTHMLTLYKIGHTVNSYEDYKYPGLKEVAIALNEL